MSTSKYSKLLILSDASIDLEIIPSLMQAISGDFQHACGKMHI